MATPKSKMVMDAEFLVLPGKAKQIVPSSAAWFIKQIWTQFLSDCARESGAVTSDESLQTIHRPLDNIGISSIQIKGLCSIPKSASLILLHSVRSTNFMKAI